MRITPKLEELIWCGEARYCTWTIGTPAAGLKVGANKTIIVLGFDYFPFIDAGVDGVSAADRAEYWERMNKQIVISDKNKRCNFLVRNYFQPNSGVRPDFIAIDCYLPFTENVNFQIATILPVFQWGIVSLPPPKESESKRIPLGVGNVAIPGSLSVPALIDFNDLLTSQMRPFADQRANQNVSFDQFQVPFNTDTQIQNPNADANFVGNQQFPMVNVHYVEINSRETGNFI